MTWSKEADWLPLSNAIAQVEFWSADLEQSLAYVDTVEKYRKYHLPNFDEIIQRALYDVLISRQGLEKAVTKLQETRHRIDSKQ